MAFVQVQMLLATFMMCNYRGLHISGYSTALIYVSRLLE